MYITTDLQQPLLRGTIVNLNGTTKWVNFRYEKSPGYCYKCGIIGHNEKNYKLEAGLNESLIKDQYGPWLKASNSRKSPQKEGNKAWTSNRQIWRVDEGDLVRKELQQEKEKQGRRGHQQEEESSKETCTWNNQQRVFEGEKVRIKMG